MSTTGLATRVAGKGSGGPQALAEAAAAVKVALIDNGSLAAEPHQLLRRVAAEISRRTGIGVAAVSWKHSDRAALPDASVASVLKTWVPAQIAAGAREFLFVPFFISPQGAIAGALRSDLDALGATYRFTAGLTPPLLGRIVAERVNDVIQAQGLASATVVVVDHGGPSPFSGAVRDETVAIAAQLLGSRAAAVAAASMETPDPADPAFAHNRPLLAEALPPLAARSADASCPLIIAPLFLAPGRHAGPDGDLARIAAAAAPGRRLFFTELVGAHPLVPAALAAALTPHIPVLTALP